MRILLLSDAHIHDRADEIPRELLEVIEKEKFDISIYAGDFTDRDVYDWFLQTGKKVYVVQGNMDYLDLPKYQKIILPDLKIGVIHGHQVRPRGNVVQLTQIAKEMNVNILISGHTHSPFIRIYENILHLNPGSVTGAWGGGGGSMKPSMMILNIDKNVVKIEHYELTKKTLNKIIKNFILRAGNWEEL